MITYAKMSISEESELMNIRKVQIQKTSKENTF